MSCDLAMIVTSQQQQQQQCGQSQANPTKGCREKKHVRFTLPRINDVVVSSAQQSTHSQAMAQKPV